MSAPNPLIVPTTAAVTVQFSAQEGDQVLIYRTGTWGVGEAAAIQLPTSTGSLTDYIDPTTVAPVLIGNSLAAWNFPGGYLYTIVKGVTAAAAGLDVQIKPRIGPH